MIECKAFDFNKYLERSQSGPCFICETIKRNPEYHNYVIYEDEFAIVFLNKYPTLFGYTLVAPRAHREQATGDFTLDEYLQLQKLVYQAAEAVRQEVPTERLYILTLGSQQGNRHVHWHIAPLPPGVPYEQQQVEALKMENGILNVPEREMVSLAERIGRRIKSLREI